MEAEALVKVDPLVNIVVASLAPALIAVDQAERCPIVASRDDSLVLRDDGTISSLHTV